MKKERKIKILTLGMYKPITSAINPYSLPSKMTKTTYELRMCDRLRKFVTTDTFNMEVILVELIRFATDRIWMKHERQKPIPYHIYVTQNGVKELLIDSAEPDHQKFILFLCQPGNK